MKYSETTVDLWQVLQPILDESIAQSLRDMDDPDAELDSFHLERLQEVHDVICDLANWVVQPSNELNVMREMSDVSERLRIYRRIYTQAHNIRGYMSENENLTGVQHPTTKELFELSKVCNSPSVFARQVLKRWGNVIPEAISITERLPEEEDFDPSNTHRQCWWFRSIGTWKGWVFDRQEIFDTHWLPYYTFPIPQT